MIPVTYSPSWTFIPTHYCRNTCGYCVFVKRSGAEARLASVERAAAEIEHARRAGATELLIMSGEGIESARHARDSLAAWGFADYISYLTAISRLALAEGILPHVNIGNVTEDEIRRLRAVVPSMGMMLETVEDLSRVAAHRRAPDKQPARRLETLRAAGRARMPWTTGILIGIGESLWSRRASLEAIAQIHDEYGHIQEVIIQPFTPHARTKMASWNAPTLTELCDAVRLAREVLPPEVTVQMPPNIAPEIVEFVLAGARDLGGVSTDGDRINPDERWLAPARYAATLAPHGFRLRPRLAVYEHYVSAVWLARETLSVAREVKKRLEAHRDMLDDFATTADGRSTFSLDNRNAATFV